VSLGDITNRVHFKFILLFTNAATNENRKASIIHIASIGPGCTDERPSLEAFRTSHASCDCLQQHRLLFRITVIMNSQW